MNENIDVTFLIPCLNEELTLPSVILEIKESFDSSSFSYEILVADNGSTDASVEIAERHGCRVVTIPERGYGAAILGGVRRARGNCVVMGDADGSYRFSESFPLIDAVLTGSDLAMGNRFLGEIHSGAMPWKNRKIGNPALSLAAKVATQLPIGDFHCGLRAFSREAFLRLNLRSPGMEFASEMLIEAGRAGFSITEFPVNLWPDLRDRKPHLRPIRDGFRHLFLIQRTSTRITLGIPAIVLLLLASVTIVAGLFGGLRIGGMGLGIVSGLVSLVLLVLSSVFLGVAKIIDHVYSRVAVCTRKANRYVMWLLPAVLLCGILPLFFRFLDWRSVGFSKLDTDASLGGVLAGTALILISGIWLIMLVAERVIHNLHCSGR
jgi:hypothetical protein